MAAVSFKNVVKSYGSVEVIHDVSLDVADGEFMVLVGPSGCGKSTLLRMLAGLEWFSEGTIAIDGRIVNSVAAKDRDIAMVFQSYALYPHMSVAQNMAFGLELRRERKDAIEAAVARAARILDLAPYLDRYPRELSGGQRQRVAMGRAIVRNPKVFLFDEPLSNLDAKLRVAMRAEIKSLQQTLRTTTVYVTHDQVEAMTMADRIAVLREGRIEQVGTPLAIYDRPANLFVAQFLGSHGMNIVEGRYDAEQRIIAADDGERELRWPAPAVALATGTDVALGIRPDALEIVAVDAPQAIPARVKLVQRTGADTELILALGRIAMTLVAHERLAVAAGEVVGVRAPVAWTHVFARSTGLRVAEAAS